MLVVMLQGQPSPPPPPLQARHRGPLPGGAEAAAAPGRRPAHPGVPPGLRRTAPAAGPLPCQVWATHMCGEQNSRVHLKLFQLFIFRAQLHTTLTDTVVLHGWWLKGRKSAPLAKKKSPRSSTLGGKSRPCNCFCRFFYYYNCNNTVEQESILAKSWFQPSYT